MPTVAELAEEAEVTADAEALRGFGSHRSASVRAGAAANPAAEDDMVAALLQDPAETVRLGAASNLADRPALQLVAARSSEKRVRAILAHTFGGDFDRSLPRQVQLLLADDDFSDTREHIAETTNHVDIFEQLMRDSHRRVRAACALNPRITRAQMERLVTDRDSWVRAGATEGFRYPDDEQLMRLARDRSKAVRWAVLTRPSSPREALELIAQDTDEVNRGHAQRALANGRGIYSEEAFEQYRTELALAMRVPEFSAANGEPGQE